MHQPVLKLRPSAVLRPRASEFAEVSRRSSAFERAQLVSSRQTIYHGIVKPKEARHDADLYRLYQKVAREIETSGGKVRRVVLDFELKKDLYQALSRIRPDKDPRYERIFIANQFDLKVVDGKIPIPDLRIEYEDDCRDVRRLDLEIATRDYRPQGVLRQNSMRTENSAIPCRDGCPIQVVPSPSSAKNLSRSNARAVYLYI